MLELKFLMKLFLVTTAMAVAALFLVMMPLAIVSLGSIDSSANGRMSEFARAVEHMEMFFDAAIEEECHVVACPPGTTRTTNPNHKQQCNGCGTFGFEWQEEILPHKGIKECCNIHDYCYDECGIDKDLCDQHFKSCLYTVCASMKDELSSLHIKMCKATAKIMYTTSLALGCKAFQDAQRLACKCTSD